MLVQRVFVRKNIIKYTIKVYCLQDLNLILFYDLGVYKKMQYYKTTSDRNSNTYEEPIPANNTIHIHTSF